MSDRFHKNPPLRYGWSAGGNKLNWGQPSAIWRGEILNCIEYFQNHAVQLQLQKGDVMFLSPALFHAAGTNKESSDRIANLLQVSSAFGKTMESVDRTKMTKLVYRVLLERKKSHQLRKDELQTIGDSVIDGYSFPTNLDLDSPMEGPVTETIWAFMELASREEWTVDRFNECLNEATKV